MAPARKKAAPQSAPTTIEEATDRLASYHHVTSLIEGLKVDARAAIGQIEAARDAAIAPLEQDAKDIFLELRSWWGVAGAAMTDGKRKSIELAGCIIGERTTTPSLKMPRGVANDDLCTTLLGISPETVTIKYAVNKPVCISALRDPDSEVGRRLENDALLAVTQREEFFIDFAAGREPATLVVDTPPVEVTSQNTKGGGK